MQPLIIDFHSFGDHFQFKEYHVTNFDMVKKPATVNGFILDAENKLLLVKNNRGMWGPPGGKIEAGETPIEAFVREMYEEAAVKVDLNSLQPLFYSEAYVEEPIGEWKYLGDHLRYVCRLSVKDEFVADPDNDIIEQTYCAIEDLPKWVQWGKTTDLLIKSLRQYADNT